MRNHKKHKQLHKNANKSCDSAGELSCERHLDGMGRLFLLPPGTNKARFRRTPLWLMEDAAQECWVAHLEGRNPNGGRWASMADECRNEHGTAWRQKHKLFTQLNDNDIRDLRNKTDFEPDDPAD